MNCYHNRILAFIDVLGFKEAVKRTNEIENQHEIGFINNFFDEINNQQRMKECFPKEIQLNDRIVNQFSDSIVISYSKENFIHHIFQDAYFLCIKAMENEFLLRGAIVYGKLIHSKNDNKLFGPACLEAYEMEREKAVFPRIIIDEKIFDLAKDNYSNCDNPDLEYENLMKLISLDFDNINYINYINKYYTGVDVGEEGEQKHSILVYNNLKKLENSYKKDNKLKWKYLWLEKKYKEAYININY